MLNLGHISKEGLQNEHVLQKLGWQMVNLPQEVRNAFKNWAYLTYASNKDGLDKYIDLLMKIRDGPEGRVQCMSKCPKGSGPIIICGSGSSFDLVGPKLKDWKGAVMCSSSQASTVIYHGRIPNYIIVMDPRVASPDLEFNAPDFGDAIMLGHPSVPVPYVERWLQRAKGTFYVARIMEPTYDWYTHHLGTGYEWVHHVMLPFIDSGAAMLGYATWLGYNPIYLAGIDYSGPRLQRWDWDYDTQTWTPDKHTSGFVAKDEGNYGGLTGKQTMVYSSRGMLLSGFMQIANEKYRQRIFQLSPATVLTQFPYVKWEDCLAAQGVSNPAYYDSLRDDVLLDIEAALASWDTFLVPVQSGWGTDYHTYIAKDEANYINAMVGYNNQIQMNLKNFEEMEKAQGRTISEMIGDGTVAIEAGELLLRGADEFPDWDWHAIKQIDIAKVLERRNFLLKLADERHYERPKGPVQDITKKPVQCHSCMNHVKPCDTPQFEPGMMCCGVCGHWRACHKV